MHKDDFFKAVQEADVIVLGAPCYWGNVPGILKTFFDRHTAYAMYKPKEAGKFAQMSVKEKISTLKKQAKHFGPSAELRNKRFILAVSLTLPFPLAYIAGDLPTTLKALRVYVNKLKGKEIDKIIYTDTLFRFRKHKEARVMSKAFKMGESLRPENC